jgi:phage FluMu protein Com
MLEMEVILDFSCCICRNAMGVTLHCAGKGLAAGANARAWVKVPCPTCGCTNKIVFAPDGTLHHVAPHEASKFPEPSLN